jgi:ribosome assembly protein YihI (activator of Der GTPase)
VTRLKSNQQQQQQQQGFRHAALGSKKLVKLTTPITVREFAKKLEIKKVEKLTAPTTVRELALV